MTGTEQNVLKVSEVALRLGVERSSIIRWIRAGHFKGAYKLGPSKNSPYVIPADEVEAFIEARRSHPTSDP